MPFNIRQEAVVRWRNVAVIAACDDALVLNLADQSNPEVTREPMRHENLRLHVGLVSDLTAGKR